VIPDAAVEAAAIATYGGEYADLWADEEPKVKASYREDARLALEAAAPHLMAQALTEAAKSFSESTPEGEYASSPEQVIAWMREYADLYRSAGAGE
jgi:delta 1-pyrroline-5-carboxylate dehydrogenase